MTVSTDPGADAETLFPLSVVSLSLRSAGDASDTRLAGLAALTRARGHGGSGVPRRNRPPVAKMPGSGGGAAYEHVSAGRKLLARLASPAPHLRALQTSGTSSPSDRTVAAAGSSPARLQRADAAMLDAIGSPRSSILRAALVAARRQPSPAAIADRRNAQAHPNLGGTVGSEARLVAALGTPSAGAGMRLQQGAAPRAGRQPEQAVGARAATPQVRKLVLSGEGTARGLDRVFAAPGKATRSDIWMPEAGARSETNRPQPVIAATRNDTGVTSARAVPRRFTGFGTDGAASQASQEVGAGTGYGRREPAGLRQAGTPMTPTAEQTAGGAQGNTQGNTNMTLTGDIVIDGRKLGRLATSSQVRGASLPPRSASAVNIKALPVFTGSSVPL